MVLYNEEDGLVFRTSEHVPEVLKQILLERGWNEYDETQDAASWNLWWKTQRFRKSEHEEVAPWQRLNHFPRTDAITRKDSLVRNLRRMRCVHGVHNFSFHPPAYILPNEYTKFVSDYGKEAQKQGKKNLYWICKPVDLSRGRGIFVFHDLKSLTYDCSVIVQRYITNPLLISGYKFDLRIYVCVPSFQPLTIYMYQEGIVRFGTDKFDLNQLSNIFSHLTNTSINKYGPSYSTDKERVGPGCKWTLSQLRSYLRQLDGVDESLLWQRINNLVTLTLATQAPTVPKCRNCFEVFGFDVLIDDQMKPWLLEVNFSPALSMDCQADFIAKRSMLNDLIDLLNFKGSDAEHGGSTFRDCPSPTPSARRSLYGGPDIYEPDLHRSHHLGGNLCTGESRKKRENSGKNKDERLGTSPTLPLIHAKSSESDYLLLSSHNGFPRNLSSSSVTSSVSSVDHSNQPDNTEEHTPVAKLKTRPPNSVRPKQKRTSLKLTPPSDKMSLKTPTSSPRQLSTITELLSSENTKAPIQKRFSELHQPILSRSDSPKMTKRKKALNSAPVSRKIRSPTRSDSSQKSGVSTSHRNRQRVNIGNYKSPYSISSTAPTQTSKTTPWPRTRVGDFILTFPMNETTRKASGQNFDMKVILREQQKNLKKLMSNLNSPKNESRRNSSALTETDALQLRFQLMFEETDTNPLYFWGPQNPPLLSNMLS
nr:probable tubulin polyglutamylase TTLL1 [Ciona intestinalis]|eukprot:XP_002125626.1 probable tubulin polyglutamylase TTLL1 [Ciona intestinalis]